MSGDEAVRQPNALRDTAIRRRTSGGARAGFGLIEAILALAIAGLVLAAVTEIAGRTLRSWNGGFTAMAAVERTDIALGRIAADLAASLPVRLATADDPATLFVGDGRGMTFTAVTPIDRSHEAIAVVEIGIEALGDGAALTRRARRGREATLRDGDRVVLLSGPLDLAFSYRDRAGRRTSTWTRPGEVPAGVIVTLKGPREGGGLPVEVMLPIPVAISISCLIEVPTAAAERPRPNRAPPPPGGADAPPPPGGADAAPPPEVPATNPEERQRRCPAAPAGATADAPPSSPPARPPGPKGEPRGEGR